MNIIEVLRDKSVIRGRLWFRPVSKRGSGIGYRIAPVVNRKKPQQYAVMKSEKDAMPEISMSVFVHEIAGEWEIVSEQEVVAERYNVKRAE